MPQERNRVLSPVKRLGSFKEIHLGLTRKSAVDDARTFLERERSLKGNACLLGTDHVAVLRLLVKKDLTGAFEKLVEANPFAAVTGRLCAEPYAETKVFNRQSELISLRSIERFLADHVKVKPSGVSSRPRQKVAVIGSGPSGLMAAWELSKKGYRVTVFDQARLAGGSLAFGWPEFLLPFDVTERLIRFFTERGIFFELNTIFGRNLTLSGLKDTGFKAIVLATGAGVSGVLDIPGGSAAGVMGAPDLLRAWREARMGGDAMNAFLPVGKKVIITGGGWAGLHAARICVRRGRDVIVIVSGSDADMKADAWLVREAVEEGIKFKTFMRPEKIQEDASGFFKGLVCRPVDYRVDKEGRLSVAADDDIEMVFEGDTLIVSTENEANTLFYRTQPGLAFTANGSLALRPNSLSTELKGVFAAGALVAPAAGLLEVIISGKQAALEADQYLSV